MKSSTRQCKEQEQCADAHGTTAAYCLDKQISTPPSIGMHQHACLFSFLACTACSRCHALQPARDDARQSPTCTDMPGTTELTLLHERRPSWRQSTYKTPDLAIAGTWRKTDWWSAVLLLSCNMPSSAFNMKDVPAANAH